MEAVPARVVTVLDAETELLRGNLIETRSNGHCQVAVQLRIVKEVRAERRFGAFLVWRSIVESKLDSGSFILIKHRLDRVF